MSTISVATFALNGTDDTAANLANLLACMDQAARADARLVVFPELSLQGYPPADAVESRADVLAAVYAGAEPVPHGPSVASIAERARHLGLYVVYGLSELGGGPGEVYNTAVLTGPAGHVGSYRKVHVATTEKLMWQPGDTWPVFDTELGRVGLLICYDKAWPESTRELTLGGADLLVMPTAWSRRPDQYDLYERARALENSRWFISSNYAGRLGSRHFFGLSQVIDPSGRTVASSGCTDEQVMVTAAIDVRGGIEEALANFEGARILRDRRPSTYRRIAAQ